MSVDVGSRLDAKLAELVGLRDHRRRPRGVEGNGRLTARTGLLLLVLLFAEGITIPFVTPLFSWHIGIGLVIVPPILLKMGSTTWRFLNYYRGEPRYRRAGPPHLLLRILGPLVILSTVAVVGTGILAWLEGPARSQEMLLLHKVSFVAWFAFMTVHVVTHVLRARRLSARDARSRKSWQASSERGAALRRATVVASLLLGLALGAGSRFVTTGWSHQLLRHHLH